eukprot:Sro64_g036140.2  (187) ;mRNA; f:23405-23965
MEICFLTKGGAGLALFSLGSNDTDSVPVDTKVVYHRLVKALEKNKPLHVFKNLLCQNPRVLDLPDGILEKDFADIDDNEDEVEMYRKTLLHWACECSAPLDIIEFLVQQKPEATTESEYDDGMWLPLNSALNAAAPLDVVILLLETTVRMDSRALDWQYGCAYWYEQETCLHIACGRKLLWTLSTI